jgi:hypothetical protein
MPISCRELNGTLQILGANIFDSDYIRFMYTSIPCFSQHHMTGDMAVPLLLFLGYTLELAMKSTGFNLPFVRFRTCHRPLSIVVAWLQMTGLSDLLQ